MPLSVSTRSRLSLLAVTGVSVFGGTSVLSQSVVGLIINNVGTTFARYTDHHVLF